MYLFKAERIVLRLSLLLEFLFFIKIEINYGLAKVGKLLLKLAQTLYPKIKVWSTFSKVVGVGKAHKYFPFMQANDSKTANCLAA